MPKLIKDPEHAGLYVRPGVGTFYVKKYIPGYGNLVASLRTRERAKAIRCMDRALEELSLSTEVLIDDVVAEVLKHYETKSEKTRESFEGHWRLHLEPFFTGIPIKAVGDYWDKYRAYAKANTPARKLFHDRKHLRFILGWALRSGVIERLPVLVLDHSDKKRERGRIIAPEEIDKLKKHASDKWRFKISLSETAMRSGEISSLKFSDINMRTGIVTLRRENTKTREPRTFAIPMRLMPEVRRRYAEKKSEFLFPHRNDPTRHESRTDKTFQRIKKRAGVILKRHHFRHTAASAALSEGVAGQVVSKAFGMSERILNDVYHHLDEATAKHVARVVAKKVRGKF